MLYWTTREELSLENRLRRSYYELLRDQLDHYILYYSLVNSYENFSARNISYPFVKKRELKPRALLPDLEYEAQNSFLLIFVEDTIPAVHKKYIRFFDVNRATKKNLLKSKTLPLDNQFDRYQKYMESAQFFNFLKLLLPVDYALLIQRDPHSRVRERYMLSHFHVRIDWPIADAAEDLAKYLRYISKDLYEKGDKYAEDLQKKFFEYYGLPVMVGGRRTAAIVASQYLKRLGCITTVYAGSSESRSLIRISERGVSKSVLRLMSIDEVKKLADLNNMPIRTFKKNYAVGQEGKDSICIFHATYAYTDQSRPPDDGKLRELKPDLSWLSVDKQLILPKMNANKYPPLVHNIIYT